MSEHSSIVFAAKGDDVEMMRMVSRSALERVPPSVYGITGKGDGGGLLFNSQKLKFTLPKKIYGNHDFYFDTITKDFAANDESLGVMLCGYKGCGKTLLAEMLGNWMLNRSLPVFHIHTRPTAVNDIYQAVVNVGPCCIIIDEFEKLYEEDNDGEFSQIHFLTMLSDSSLKNILWVFTCNDDDDLVDALKCRPGRLKYYIESPKLPRKVIREYLADRPDIKPAIAHAIKASVSVLVDKDAYIFDHLRAIADIASRYDSVVDFYRHADMLNVPSLVKLARITVMQEANDERDVKCTYQDGVLDILIDGTLTFSEDLIEARFNDSKAFDKMNLSIITTASPVYFEHNDIVLRCEKRTAHQANPVVNTRQGVSRSGEVDHSGFVFNYGTMLNNGTSDLTDIGHMDSGGNTYTRKFAEE